MDPETLNNQLGDADRRIEEARSALNELAKRREELVARADLTRMATGELLARRRSLLDLEIPQVLGRIDEALRGLAHDSRALAGDIETTLSRAHGMAPPSAAPAYRPQVAETPPPPPQQAYAPPPQQAYAQAPPPAPAPYPTNAYAPQAAPAYASAPQPYQGAAAPQPYPGAPVRRGPPSILRQDVIRLLEEILHYEEAPPNWGPEERNLQLEAWSLRWRLLLRQSEQQEPGLLPRLRKAFASLAECRKRNVDTPYLPALNPREEGDWPGRLSVISARLESLRRSMRQQEMERQPPADPAPGPRSPSSRYGAGRPTEGTGLDPLEHLKALMGSLPDNPATDNEWMSEVKRALHRCDGLWRRMKDPVVAILGNVRQFVDREEFPALFEGDSAPGPTVGAAHEDPPASEQAPEEHDEEDFDDVEDVETHSPRTRLQLVQRFVRRMKERNRTGGNFTRLESVFRGLPGHDHASAREAAEILVKEGIFNTKVTPTGRWVSLNPARRFEIDRILDCGETSLLALKQWMADVTPSVASKR